MNAKSRKSFKEYRLSKLFLEFFQSNKTGGILLILGTIVSLVLANLPVGNAYKSFWETPLHIDWNGFELPHTLLHWINDGLMTIFFLLVGLEIERELYIGELSNRKRALLPVIGAIGGMLVPALIYVLFNFNSPETLSGAGIPTATDIAFAIAIMSLLGNKVPVFLKVFLTALAVIDDLGAIFVIAIFYGGKFQLAWFAAVVLLFLLMMALGKYLKVYKLWVYLPLGLVMWFCMMQSGIHATLAGVLLAFAIPFQNGEPNSISYKLQHFLHRPVTILILPIFALANTAISINSDLMQNLFSAESLGIFFGLFIGKPIGIFLAAVLSDRLKITKIPNDVSLKMIWGAGMLGGIGFTMAMFVTNLAFTNLQFIELGKISILIASTAAAVLGYLFLSQNKANSQ